MTQHYGRIKTLHDAGRSSQNPIAQLMLNDDKALHGGEKPVGFKALRHTFDLTHKPVCLYMEILTRIFDSLHIGGRRWFMSESEAVYSGLRGKVKKEKKTRFAGDAGDA